MKTNTAAATTVHTAAVAFNVWVRSAVGNKEAAAQVRRAMVEAAILTCLKYGNTSPWTLGMSEAREGKGAVAKALLAGFTAVGHLSELMTAKARKEQERTPEGRAALVEMYATEAAAKLELFEGAYLGAMPAEQTEAEKKAAKDAKEAAAAVKLQESIDAGVSEAIRERGLVEPGKVLTSADIFRAALLNITAGQFSDEMLDELRAALGVKAMMEQAYTNGKAAAESLAADAVAGVIAEAKKPTRTRQPRKAKEAPATQEAAPAAQAEELATN